MYTYIKFSLAILVALSVSRFVPHPPNFTSLLSLSFYVPVFLGVKFLPILVLSFIFTDYIIGFHSLSFFTWGSVVFIGLMSVYFNKNITIRIVGSLAGCIIFFLITNFGVWSSGGYGYSLEGLIICYTLAIPFFGYSLISTFLFSGLIEAIYNFKTVKKHLILTK